MPKSQAFKNLIPIIQATQLVGENLKSIKKKKNTKDMLNLGIKNIVGTSLIQTEANLIGSL